SPVFLTKNGKGLYAIVDMKEYDKQRATIKLLSELAKGEASARKHGWLSEEEADRLIDDL
ncbi:MAG: prevent-host-death protein, partial [Ruminiclostridium sp.]|nr:prevent-host-death protein [Ruminiclostridium sp.]